VPDLDTRSVGDGQKQTTAWLDGAPCMVKGLEEWPRVGDRYVIDGELWRVVKISDRIICEREPS
jgi:hypothetical protein